MFKSRKEKAVFRLNEEQLYEEALKEVEEGDRRDGLWAKAFANSSGDEQATKALYLKYRVQSMVDEYEVEQHNDQFEGHNEEAKVKTAIPAFQDNLEEDSSTDLPEDDSSTDLPEDDSSTDLPEDDSSTVDVVIVIMFLLLFFILVGLKGGFMN